MSSAQTAEGASQEALSFFRKRFGVDENSLEATLGTALERRVDYADVYVEYTTQDSVSLEEGIVKDGSRHLDQGVGVRAQSGERQGYAHSDEISIDSARLAAGTARAISDQGGSNSPAALTAPATTIPSSPTNTIHQIGVVMTGPRSSRLICSSVRVRR